MYVNFQVHERVLTSVHRIPTSSTSSPHSRRTIAANSWCIIRYDCRDYSLVCYQRFLLGWDRHLFRSANCIAGDCSLQQGHRRNGRRASQCSCHGCVSKDVDGPPTERGVLGGYEFIMQNCTPPPHHPSLMSNSLFARRSWGQDMHIWVSPPRSEQRQWLTSPQFFTGCLCKSLMTNILHVLF